MSEYIYYACKSNSAKIRDGDVRSYLAEIPMMRKLLQDCLSIDVCTQFVPEDSAFRPMLSSTGALPMDVDDFNCGGLRELYQDLLYLSDHPDSAWPREDGMLESANSTYHVLHRINYWTLFSALDRFSPDRKESGACKWVFCFEHCDHYLALPPRAIIRAHQDSHRARKLSIPTLPGNPDLSADTQKALSEEASDKGQSGHRYRIRVRVADIVSSEEFMSTEGTLIKVDPEELSGRTIGDELVAHMPTEPAAVIDLTGADILKEWQCELDLDVSADATVGERSES